MTLFFRLNFILTLVPVDALPDLYPAFGLRKLLDLPEHVQAVAKRSNDKRKKRKTEA